MAAGVSEEGFAMNPSNAQLCLVAGMFAINTLGFVCYFIERRDHLREVAELTARAEAPTRYTLSVVTAVQESPGPASLGAGGTGHGGVSFCGNIGRAGGGGPRFVTENELMAAYIKQLETTLPPETTARLLRIRR